MESRQAVMEWNGVMAGCYVVMAGCYGVEWSHDRLLCSHDWP